MKKKQTVNNTRILLFSRKR